MPISPPSQIGLDLTRPPALPQIVAARPAPARGTDAPAPAGFSVDAGPQPAETGKASDRPGSPESFKRFEAMVLQTFIQNMLPEDGAAVYGKGMAGDMWKSLLAEKMADAMAERGGIGIADRVLGERYAAKAAPAAQPVKTDTATPETTQAVEGALKIAPAVLDRMQRSLSGLLDGDAARSPEAATPFVTKRG